MSTETPAPPSTAPRDPYLRLQQSPEFSSLRRSLRTFVFPMTVAFLVWYALYVILSAYARGFMNTKVGGSNINIALIFGLLQFVSTFVIAWLYARFASNRLDPAARELRAGIEGDDGTEGGAQ